MLAKPDLLCRVFAIRDPQNCKPWKLLCFKKGSEPLSLKMHFSSIISSESKLSLLIIIIFLRLQVINCV